MEASNTGPHMQAPFIPSTVSTLQVLQAPKPQLIMRSSDTSQYAPTSAAAVATFFIMTAGPQLAT